MDNLLKFIKEIKGDEKFQELDGPAIKQGIVLKLLSLLEWDPFNMDEIQPEYAVTKGKIDFALMKKESAKVFISVEKDFKDFEKSEDGLLNRAVECDVAIAVFTDGFTWCFVLPLAEGNIEDKKVCILSIDEDEPEDVQQGLMDFLSKKAITSDEAQKKAEEIFNERKKALLIEEHLPKAWEKLMDTPEKWLVGIVSELTEDLCGQKPDKEVVEEFIIAAKKEGMAKAAPQEGADSGKSASPEQKDYKGKNVKSFTLDGKTYKVKTWKDMLLELCNVMYEKNKDDFESVLYITLDGKDCFSENQHGFLNSGEIKGANLYVNLDLSAVRTVALCQEILKNFGLKEKDLSIETA